MGDNTEIANILHELKPKIWNGKGKEFKSLKVENDVKKYFYVLRDDIMLLKKTFKKIVIRLNIYEYLRYSTLFNFYAKIFKPHLQREYQREKSFYSSFLTSCHLIFDIGGYDGHKTDVFLSFADKIVCCEPDSKNFKLLKRRFRRFKKQVQLHNIALSADNGIKEFYIQYPGSAFNTLNPKFKSIAENDKMQKWNEKINYFDKRLVRVYTLDNLIKIYGKPDFIKIDVEGYELEVLKGLHTPISFISIECLYPEFEEEFKEIIKHLLSIETNLAFNISINEKLIFEQFQSKEYLMQYLNDNKITHFETIIQMIF